MIQNIYRNFELDFGSISFSNIETSYDNSFSFIRLNIKVNNNNNNTKICIQTPELINESGLLINNNGKFYLKLKTNSENLEFDEFITMMDQYIIEYVFKNNIKNMGDTLLDYTKKYIYSIKNENNTKYMLSKLQKDADNIWAFEIYDSEKNLIKNNYFNKNEKLKAILICDGIWFTDNNFGLIWSIGQMQILEKKIITGFSIVNDENKHILF